MKSRRAMRGSTLVEFALVLPLFMFLVMTIMDFGRAYMIKQAITNAAREGARFAVAPYPGTNNLPTTSAVNDQVCNFLTAASVTCGSGQGKAAVAISTTTSNFNGLATSYTNVTVTYTGFKFVYLVKVNLSSNTVMRNETSS